MDDSRLALIRTGLVGSGIQGSKSPAMHMEEAQAQGLPLSYVLFDLEGVAEASAALAGVLDEAEAQGFSGVNITYPFKQAVIPLLHELSGGASRLGAVNTVVFKGGRRIGHNTDWSGFAESFRRGLPEAPIAKVVQLGAGGAGAAVSYALLTLGVRELRLFDVDPDRARERVDKLAGLFGSQRVKLAETVETALAGADGVVNASPVGMAKFPGLPLPLTLLHPGLWVAEIVYFPLETELLTTARRIGCRTLDGGGMAVFQAAEAFHLFTGAAPDTERMLARFREVAQASTPHANDPLD